jgi:DNA-binding CsgD family transcriptional regulator/PAS domain-containing protein
LYSEQDLLNLVGKIYECAADPSGWDGFLADLARIGRGTVTALTYHDDRHDEHVVSGQFGLSPEEQRLYREHYGAMDEWFLGSRKVVHTGWVGPGQLLVSDEALAKSEFYNDYLRHNDDAFHLCSAMPFVEPNALAALSISRPRKVGPFGESHLRLLRLLLPHLQRALQLHREFVALRRRSSMLESSLDQVTTAILFVDVTGRILVANRSAAALLQKRDGLLATRDGLRANTPRESAHLEKLIRAVAATGNSEGLSAGGAVQVTRKPPRMPLSVLVAPIKLDLSNLTPQRPVAAVFITDPEQRIEPSGEILRRLYSVTPAEQKLAALLAQGLSLRQAAETRRVTIGTARSQLKSIFRKTNVSSQSQLVRFLMLLPPAFNPSIVSPPNGR